MEKFVLDTNLFFNMEAGLGLGKTTKEVIENMTKIIKYGKHQKKAEFFMPPRTVSELLSFFDDKKQSYLQKLLSVITIESPDLSTLSFPATVFYKLVADIRKRSYRGLSIGEEEIVKAGQIMENKKKLSKKEFQISLGPVVKKFRERYRHATRFGFLDSLADLDVITLAKQKQAFLVSSDEGVLSWGRKFGVKEMPVEGFLQRLSVLFQKNLPLLEPNSSKNQ